MALIRCLTIVVMLNCLLFADDPPKPVKRQFPAKLTSCHPNDLMMGARRWN